ncbi:aromatic-L-amino-acid decarboxylase-like [Sycon ciliatum]|uniref:aromatic-L-amino-acid decarboxylase-like n=1 Tax=Sycon ciliatum TaxID=27933 RepID=UPI0031F6C1BA
MDELGISPESFQELLEKITPLMLQCIRDIDDGPTCFIRSLEDSADSVDLAKQLAAKVKEESVPETGEDVADILHVLCDVAARGGKNNASAGFCAYVPTGGLLQSAVIDLVSAILNRATPRFLSSPGMTQIDSNVIAWMASVVGYDPAKSFGSFTSGGSMANFVGILAARRKYLPEEQISQGAVMATSQTHSCIGKGLIMAGIPRSSLCLVECDEKLRMCPAALEKCIVAQRTSGRKPFLVVASAGTTNTGAVDDLRAVSAICRRHDVWLHVDGVYGAAFNLTQFGREQLDGLEEADSIAIDLHKSFFLPQATGLLMVKDRFYLKNAFTHDVQAPFLPELAAEEDNFLDLSPDLTRPLYGLRLWFPLKLCGIRKWRAALYERLDWTAEFADGLRKMSGIGVELTTEPSLTILTFRYAPPAVQSQTAGSSSVVQPAPQASTERLAYLRTENEKLLVFINCRGTIYLSGTTLPDGRYVIRVCVLNIRLTHGRLMKGLADISDGVKHIAAHV